MKTCCLKTNKIQTCCDTGLTFCVTIGNTQGYFLRGKLSPILLCPYGKSTYLLHIFKRFLIKTTEFKNNKADDC